MPTYDYACENCGHEMEVFQRMSDDLLTVCPECGTPSLKRKIGTGAGIIFKGGGFYETDFKDKKGASKSSGDGDAKKAGSGEGSEKSAPKETPKPAAAASEKAGS